LARARTMVRARVPLIQKISGICLVSQNESLSIL
jgi:hypothetical protein